MHVICPHCLSEVDAGKEMARVVEPMVGVDVTNLESYAVFITTNASTESNMFFWFFPATVGVETVLQGYIIEFTFDFVITVTMSAESTRAAGNLQHGTWFNSQIKFNKMPDPMAHPVQRHLLLPCCQGVDPEEAPV